MNWGRRCDAGCATWPDMAIYTDCPICGEPTERFSNVEPLDAEEAALKMSGLMFQDFYEGHCLKKGQSVDGPLLMSPEESLPWQEKYPGGRPDNF